MNIHVYGVPVGKGSMRAMVRGDRAVMFNDSPDTMRWQRAISKAASCKPGIGAHFNCPCEVDCSFTFRRPKSSKRDWPSVKPDIDKCLRTVLDALTGVAWRDDSQVVGIGATKLYGETPGVEMNIRWCVDGLWVDE